jgi:hypothetical protein
VGAEQNHLVGFLSPPDLGHYITGFVSAADLVGKAKLYANLASFGQPCQSRCVFT